MLASYMPTITTSASSMPACSISACSKSANSMLAFCKFLDWFHVLFPYQLTSFFASSLCVTYFHIRETAVFFYLGWRRACWSCCPLPREYLTSPRPGSGVGSLPLFAYTLECVRFRYTQPAKSLKNHRIQYWYRQSINFNIENGCESGSSGTNI